MSEKKSSWLDDMFELAAVAVVSAPAVVAGGIHAGYKVFAEDSASAKKAFEKTVGAVIDTAAEFGRENGRTIAKTVIVSVIASQSSGAINRQIEKYRKS